MKLCIPLILYVHKNQLMDDKLCCWVKLLAFYFNDNTYIYYHKEIVKRKSVLKCAYLLKMFEVLSSRLAKTMRLKKVCNISSQKDFQEWNEPDIRFRHGMMDSNDENNTNRATKHHNNVLRYSKKENKIVICLYYIPS